MKIARPPHAFLRGNFFLAIVDSFSNVLALISVLTWQFKSGSYVYSDPLKFDRFCLVGYY